MSDFTEYRYQTNFGFEGENAYKLLNRALGYKLKNNTDKYSCEKYRLSLDYDLGFVYFKELDRTFIKDTMNKIVKALGDDKWYWDVTDEIEDCDIEDEDQEEEQFTNKVVEEEEEEYIVPVSKKQKLKEEEEYKNTITMFNKTFKYNILECHTEEYSNGNYIGFKFIDCFIINDEENIKNNNTKVKYIDCDCICEDIRINK